MPCKRCGGEITTHEGRKYGVCASCSDELLDEFGQPETDEAKEYFPSLAED